MGSYFENLKEELNNIRSSQEFMLLQMGIEPEPIQEIEENDIKQIVPLKIGVSARRQYLSANYDEGDRYSVDDNLESNKRFLDTGKE